MESQEHFLRQFSDEPVKVHYLDSMEHTDTGEISQVGDGWFMLARLNAPALLVPFTAVRIIALERRR